MIKWNMVLGASSKSVSNQKVDSSLVINTFRQNNTGQNAANESGNKSETKLTMSLIVIW